MTSFDKITATSLTENIYDVLVGKIISGEMKTGDWLPAERDMAEQMGVSRSSLHQAILQLSNEGFLNIVPRRGTVVADYRKYPTPKSLSALMHYGSVELDEPIFRDMMDTRIWLEMECARRACSNIYGSTLNQMQELADSFIDQGEDLAKRIYKFHYLLTQASGNAMFSLMFRAFESVITVLIDRHYRLKAVDIKEAAAMHQELLRYIREKNEDAAAECVKRIIVQGRNVLELKYE
jgi:DNA-binding FadR family transcriptional regulator